MIGDLHLVTVAMKEAFKYHGIKITPEVVNQFRGMDKKEAIKNIFNASRTNDTNSSENKPIVNENALLENIFKDFKVILKSHMTDINKEISGTTGTFHFLRSKGVKLAVGSGFPHDIVVSLVDKLGWKDMVHFASSAEKEGRGRPRPSLIHSAMRHCCVSDKRKVLKVGDTVIDIEEAKNAGCKSVAVLTGTQSEERLKESNPDFIIKSVAELPKLIKSLEGIK